MPDIGFLKALGVRMVDLPNLIASLLDEASSQTELLRSRPAKCRSNAMLNVISRTCFALTLVCLSLALPSCGYNTIPTLQEQAKARWSDVQNQYQRRADLIPNLVATVQGYAAQEKNVLTAVVEARANNVISAQRRGALETKLKKLEDKSSIQLVVATVK